MGWSRSSNRRPISTGTAAPPWPFSGTPNSARSCLRRCGVERRHSPRAGHFEIDVSDLLASGDYARKQIYCPSRVVAWSHGSRFRLAARLAASASGGRLLDYGCGDGTFMALTHGSFAEAVGADIDVEQLAECRRRLADLSGLMFVHTIDLHGLSHERGYDVV